MRVNFSKYHGTGNDFLMIDGRGTKRARFNTNVIRELCERRFGIGADGMIFLEESRHFDFSMRYFNSDGREGSMCGNGGRCITAFARDLGIIKTRTSFEGIDGAHEAVILPNGEIRLKLIDVEGIELLEDGYLLNTGSPHFVLFVKELEHLDVEQLGRQIRHEKRFGSQGVNVNFAERLQEPDAIRVRTFERGVEGETWSCGTGVTAAAISASIDSGTASLAYRVHTRGGKLEVSFRKRKEGAYSDIYLTGPASHVYDGTIEITV